MLGSTIPSVEEPPSVRDGGYLALLVCEWDEQSIKTHMGIWQIVFFLRGDKKEKF